MTTKLIEDIGINHRSRYYPKHFIAPKKWMRKFFHINQRVIPRYLYFELYISLFYIVLGLFTIVIGLAVDEHKSIIGILIISQLWFEVINAAFAVIMSKILKRK